MIFELPDWLTLLLLMVMFVAIGSACVVLLWEIWDCIKQEWLGGTGR